jgi:chromosome segregation ATPase
VTEETNQAEAGQEPITSQQPQAGQTTPAPAVQATVGRSAEELEADLKKANAEAAKHRTDKNLVKSELEKLRAELDKLQAASMSEQERKDKEHNKAVEKAAQLEAQLAEATKRNQELLLRTAVQAAATKLGIVDPDAAYLLLDKTQVEPSDDGKIDTAKIEAALTELLKAKTYLRGVAHITATNPAKSAGLDPNVETSEQRRARIYGGGLDIFDAKAAKARGGGVIMPWDS